MDEQPLVFNVDENGFESRVIEASRRKPVAVDFWAEWCAPCRALGPVLEKVVTALAGRIRLAKVNTEENQQLVAALAVRSLPTVKLFNHGRVVDEFIGAYPEIQVREFLSRHLEEEPGAVDTEIRDLLSHGDTEQARVLLRQAVAADPENARLKLDLAAVEMSLGDYRRAEATLRELPLEKRQDEGAKRLFARLHFYLLCENSASLEELARTVEQDPEDLNARLGLGARKVLEENYGAAMDQLLEVIRRNKGFQDAAARKSMLLIFELLGHDDPLVGRYRSLMAAALY